jgi:hypothetical protein
MAPTREAPRRRQSHDGVPPGPVSPISSLHAPRNTWRRRTLRFARRLAALGAFAAAAFVAYTYVAAPLLGEEEEQVAVAEEAAPNGEASPAAGGEPPPRPASVPTPIPQWAWDLNEWHSTAEDARGPRPDAATRRVPEWYWEWRAWRAELAARAGS